MEIIVSKLSTLFSTPEEVILTQGDDASDGMYFISMGDCAVNVIDEHREIHIAYKNKILVEGDHFGEIGVIYNCLRTATIVSRNYNTLANLNKERFDDLMNLLPQYLDLLKRHAYKYQEPLKLFVKKIISKIPYFDP